MVRDKQEAKKLVTARKAAHREKTSQIAGMLPDEEYIAMLSAVACPTPSGGAPHLAAPSESCTKKSSRFALISDEVPEEAGDGGCKPLSKAERRLQKKNLIVEEESNIQGNKEENLSKYKFRDETKQKMKTKVKRDHSVGAPQDGYLRATTTRDDEAINSPANILLSSNSASSPATVETSDDHDGFASCLSASCSTANCAICSSNSNGDEEQSNIPTKHSGYSTASSTTTNPDNAAVPQWYADAVALLSWDASADVRSEGYSAYLYEHGHRHRHDPIVNPYIVSEHCWWETVKKKQLDQLNARLAREMRLQKTGSEEHGGTKESSKTKENKKIEKFCLPTNNRFAGLAETKVR